MKLPRRNFLHLAAGAARGYLAMVSKYSTASLATLGGILVAAALAGAAFAGPFEDAIAAFNRADYATALRYYFGHGVQRDYAEALKWFRKAADQGDADAQNGLGLMYREGHGVQQDYAEALKWFRKAADQGNANAQFKLGAMYEMGVGVPPNLTEALKWLRKAAEQDEVVAQSFVGTIYANGGCAAELRRSVEMVPQSGRPGGCVRAG